jgi:SAM-dependent methyltransferase
MRSTNSTELLRLLERYSPGPTDYFRHGADRIVASINMIPDGEGKVLELGCDSHFTLAASLLTAYQVVPQNSPRPIAAPENVDDPSIEFSRDDGETVKFKRALFDIEKSKFPYDDNSFDGIICCELIEHLFYDPAHMLHESNRVLKPGGWILLTTPNVTSYHMIRKAIIGNHPLEHSLYFHEKHGCLPIQHTREYTFWEIVNFLDVCGFRVEKKASLTFTKNERLGFFEYAFLIPMITLYNCFKFRHPKHLLPRYRKPHTFVLARKSGAPTDRFPAGIYLQ